MSKDTTTLATFRIKPELWEAFKALCTESEVTVTSELLRFITACVDRGALPQSDESLVKGGDLAEKLDMILAAIQSQGNRQGNQSEPTKKHWPLAS